MHRVLALRSTRKRQTAGETVEPANPGTALGQLKLYWPELEAQMAAAEESDRWVRGEHDPPYVAQDAPREIRELAEICSTPFGGVVVNSNVQNLFVESFSASAGSDGGTGTDAVENSDATLDNPNPVSPMWGIAWQANKWDAKQSPLLHDALAHGVSYLTQRIGEDQLTGTRMPVWRGVSARFSVAMWRAYEQLDFPECFIEAQPEDTGLGDGISRRFRVELWDGLYVHVFYRVDEGPLSADDRISYEYVDSTLHGAKNIVPVVPFTPYRNLSDEVRAEVNPLIPILRRCDQAVFDRLVVQRLGSWRVRTASGVTLADGVDEQKRISAYMRQTMIMASEDPQARFGTLEPSPTEGFISARESDIRDLSSTSQLAPHQFLGLSPNVSAEGLTESQRSQMKKLELLKHAFGESYELAFRLSAHIMGMTAEAARFDAQVKWRDTEARSLAQISDALGKLAQLVGIPVEMLWEMLPDWTGQDTERAIQLNRERQRQEDVRASIEAGQVPGDYQSTAGREVAPKDDDERRRKNRIRGGYGPDWDGDGRPN